MVEGVKTQNYPPCESYTQKIRAKFLLIFAIFSVNVKQSQASMSTDFFQKLEAYISSQPKVEPRIQMGIDFACQFQLSQFELLHVAAKLEVLNKMYELLCQ